MAAPVSRGLVGRGGVAALCLPVGQCLCADGRAVKSPQCSCQGCRCEGLCFASRWAVGEAGGSRAAGCLAGDFQLLRGCRGAAGEMLQGARGHPARCSSSLPSGPGPLPVPSPAGSPGQHHGRRPGSPGAPGRGLLDSPAPGGFAQGLLRLRVQAPCPAGAGGPGPRALGLAPHGAHPVPHGGQGWQGGQRAGRRRPPGLQAPCGEEDHDEPHGGHRGLPGHGRGERLLPVVHLQLRLPQLLLPGLHRPGLLPQGPGQEAAQRPEWSRGRCQDRQALQHHQLRPGRLLHHPGLHLPAVPAHRLLRPRRADGGLGRAHFPD